MIEVRSGLNYDDCYRVFENMREADRLEVGAVLPHCDLDALVYNFCLNSENIGCYSATVYLQGDPVCVLTLNYETGTSLQASMIATNDFEQVGSRFTRFLRKNVRPVLIDQGVRRIEARCLAQHEHAIKWMTAMGAKKEVVIPEYGYNRETFIQMGWNHVHVS